MQSESRALSWPLGTEGGTLFSGFQAEAWEENPIAGRRGTVETGALAGAAAQNSGTNNTAFVRGVVRLPPRAPWTPLSQGRESLPPSSGSRKRGLPTPQLQAQSSCNLRWVGAAGSVSVSGGGSVSLFSRPLSSSPAGTQSVFPEQAGQSGSSGLLGKASKSPRLARRPPSWRASAPTRRHIPYNAPSWSPPDTAEHPGAFKQIFFNSQTPLPRARRLLRAQRCRRRGGLWEARGRALRKKRAGRRSVRPVQSPETGAGSRVPS